MRNILITLDAVVDFTTFIIGIVLADKCRATCLQYGMRLLLTGTVQIDLIGYLLFACATFAEDDGVGIDCRDCLYLLFNLLPSLADSRHQLIVKSQNYMFRFGIFANRFHKLLVVCRALDYIHSAAITHYFGNFHTIQVFHYGYDREFVPFGFEPVD